MIKSWASVNPHVDAMCKIPAGCGFGGRKLRVIMGEMGALGRKVCRRWLTGPLFFEIHQYSDLFFFSFFPKTGNFLLQRQKSFEIWIKRGPNVLEIPGANAHPDPLSFQVRHQLLQAGLRLLHQHSCGFNGADLGHGIELLFGREGVDVLEDVGFGRDGEGLSVSSAKG